MGLVFNASAEDQHIVVFGNHFTMKAKQIKNFEDRISNFIMTERREFGLVTLPEEFMEPEFKNSPEGKAILEEKEREGIEARTKHLRAVIYNNEVSLKQDLERANIKVDPKVYASSGEVAAYRELAKYRKAQEDLDQAKVEELKKLEAEIKKGV
jgi:hypothetical protein